MQDPFRPNSNAQLMREAQFGLIVVGLLLCVLVYVAFYRLTNRSKRFDEISRNVPVAKAVDGDPYPARSIVKMEQRLDENKKKPRPAIETFPTKIEKNTVGLRQSPPDKKVAQALHISPQAPSGSFVAKSAFADQELKGSTASKFDPIANRVSAMAKSDQTMPLKKLPKVRPPVLQSEFGGNSSQDFIPVPIAKKNETKKESSGFSPALNLPSKLEMSSALNLPPKPKSPVPEKIDKILKRQLATAANKDQSDRFAPEPIAPQRQIPPKKTDFSRPQQAPLIAQTSAMEPIERAATAVLRPSKKSAKKSAKASNKSDRTYTTRDAELDQRFYVTEDGDTLFEIARQRFGQASRYLEIYKLNRFRIPETANHLTPLGGGIELLLPE